MKQIDTQNWGEFKVGDLFEIYPTKSYKLINKDMISITGNNPVVVNSSFNNGIGFFTDYPITEDGNIVTFSDTTTCNSIFYQKKSFIGYSHVQGLHPIKYKEKWEKYCYLFFITVFKSKSKSVGFDYTNKFTREIAQNMILKLPITPSGDLDFSYMESYMKNFESFVGSSLANLLSAKNEKKQIDTQRWGEFRIGDLFEKMNVNKLKMKVLELPKEKTNDYFLPALTAGVKNQGLSCYISPENSTILKEVISVSANGANTGEMFYQPKEFTILQDAFAIHCKIKKLSKYESLFIITYMSKKIKSFYNWGNKATWDKIKNEFIKLPITPSGDLDFSYMESYMKNFESFVGSSLANLLSAKNEKKQIDT